MQNKQKDYYISLLEKIAYRVEDKNNLYPPIGNLWKIKDSIGQGYYWVYFSPNHFNIKIHNFSFNSDQIITLNIPDCISSSYYISISGEELNPYRILIPNVVKSFLGGIKPFEAIIHKDTKIHSIGIEWEPIYYEEKFKLADPLNYKNIIKTFKTSYESSNFVEISKILLEIENYRSDDIAAQFFYESKALETLSLLYRRMKTFCDKENISKKDEILLLDLASYINEHCYENLTLDYLSKKIGMCKTNLKSNFKNYFSTTIGEYIKEKRMEQAENLLSFSNLSIGEIANKVGYKNAGRFSSNFKESYGMLPKKYKKKNIN